MAVPTEELLAQLARKFLGQAIEAGLRAAVRAYYESNTDADRLDDVFYRAIESIAGETGSDLNAKELISDVEEEINFDGGIKGTDGLRHGVATPPRGD